MALTDSSTTSGTIVENGDVSSISSSQPPPDSEASLIGGSSNSSPSPSMAPNGSAEEQPNDMDALSPSSPTESPGAPSHGKHKHKYKSSRKKNDDSNTAGLIAGVLILALIIVCVICLARRKKKKQPQKHPPHRYPQGGGKYPGQPMDYVVRFNQTPGGPWATPGRPPNGLSSSEFSEMGYQPSPLMMGGYGGRSQFSYEELEAATDGFSEANVLGQGGFGYVHKCVFPDGKIVAVKSLKAGSGQGEREFQAEVEIISRVHHRHLVSLVGYCIFSDKRMLVYEFVPNNTLEFHLHAKGQPVMNWATRMHIAIGAAKGLAYLHEDCHPRIIHRDIKSANILLDNNFEAKVADFGLAKLNVDNFTHVSTRVMGTFGYLAPEYAASGKLTEKSDVFSYGVMLVEIISGHRPVDPTNRTIKDSLVDWARPLMAEGLESGDYSELVDKRLGDNYVPQEMARMVSCANAAIRHSARRRPRMSQIVRALDGGSLDDLNEKSKTTDPSSAATQGMHSDIYDTRAYNADMMKFRKMVLLDEDDSSIIIDGTTSGSSSKP